MNQSEVVALSLWPWNHFLVDIIKSFPSLRIVLASPLVHRHSMSFIKTRLPEEIRKRVEGALIEASADESIYDIILTDVAYRGQRDQWLYVSASRAPWPLLALIHKVHCDPEKGLSCPATRAWLRTMLHVYTYGDL